MRWVDELVSYAQESLADDRELEALWTRGVTDEQIRDFQIGYIRTLPPTLGSEEFHAWWRVNKLEDVHVFPLTNALGQVKGLQFRHVTRGVGGYMDFFVAKDEPAYFGFHQAMPHVWKTQSICLVEGVFDLFPVQRHMPWTVTTLTSTVTAAFLRWLKRNVKEVWFFYDMDKAGREGWTAFADKHQQEFSRVLAATQFPRLHLPDGKRAKDPSDAWEVLGDERFGVCLKSAFEKVPTKRGYNG